MSAVPSSDRMRLRADSGDERELMSRMDEDWRFFQTRLDDYRLDRRIGRGAMGVVYAATDLRDESQAAVKIVRGITPADAAFLRIRREAETVARLRHPGIAELYQVGQADDLVYLAMQLVPGVTLRDWLNNLHRLTPECLNPVSENDTDAPAGGFHRAVRFDGPPTSPDDLVVIDDEIVLPRAPVMRDLRYVARVAEILRDLADALAFAHDAGVVHRDVKPDNVVLRPDGRVVLIDFGLARSLAHTTATATGALLGTPGYMAPEQLRGRAVSAAADQYALGVLGYELLTRTLPFRGATVESLIGEVLNRDIPPLRSRNPAVPAALADVLHKATAKRPEDRYRTVAEMRDDLDRFLAEGRTSARPYRYRFRPRELLADRPVILAAAGLANLMAGAALGLFALLFLVTRSPATPLVAFVSLAHAVAGRQFGWGGRFARAAGWSIAALAAAAGVGMMFSTNAPTFQVYLLLGTVGAMFFAVSAVTLAALLSRDVADWLRRMRCEREAFVADTAPREDGEETGR